MESFCLNVKFWRLGFLILQMSQIYKLSFMSTNFIVDFLFGTGLPSLASSFEIKKILKSSANIIILFWLIPKNFNKLWSSLKILHYSVSVHALYKFIRIYWPLSNMTTRIKILPVLSVFCLLKTKDVLPRQAIRTPHELDALWDKKTVPLKSLTNVFSFLIAECVSYKK